MSLENFRKRILSNEHEQDDFFLPSDKVWDAVEEELDEKRKTRKPFMLFFSSLILVLAFASLVIPNASLIKSNESKMISYKLEPSTKSNTNTNTRAANSMAASDIQDIVIATVSSDKQIKKEAASTISANNPDLTKRSDRDNVVNKNLMVKKNIQTHYYSDVNMINDQLQKSSDSPSQLTANRVQQNYSQYVSSELNKEWPIQKEADESLTKQILKDELFINRLPILTSNIELDINDKLESPALVEIHKPSANTDWNISVYGYSSISNYSISDYSGFDEIDFSLKGKSSFGYQITIDKTITDRVSVYGGIGVDHAHFNANYLLEVDQDQLEFLASDNTAALSKTIPSLAGGLESTFLLNNISSNLSTTTVDLSLAHDFKTIIVPIGAKISAVNATKLKSSFSLGIEYSKRLLSIDTGVNSLSSNDVDIELTSVAAVENENQPFKIHNINATASISADYLVTPRISVGVQTGISKPMISVYEDDNYSVNSYQIRGGINVKYAISSKFEH